MENRQSNQHSKRIVKKRKSDELYIDNQDNKYKKDDLNIFIFNLYSICNDDKNYDIVTFYDKGGFVIKNIELFKKIIKNKYKNDYASFIRNLNNYGFVNISPRNRYDKHFFTNLNVNEIIYANPYFLNNKNTLQKLCAIKCNSIHLNSNTFMKEIKELHNKETNEIINLLLYLKNSKNI